MMISGAGSEVKPSHKKKTPPQCDESSSFSSLPYELIVECFARISKSHYRSLSLVSKTFHSLLSSPELYAGRSKANDICLYICLRLPKRPCPRWFSLWIKPNRTPTKSSGNFMVPISSSSDSLPASKSTVAMGSDIYAIGGTVAPSSAVRIFDCRRHTWRAAPNMMVARSNPVACVLGDKIYVMGGCHGSDKSTDWSEVFDTKTQTWRLIPNHDAEATKEGTWNIMDMRRIVWCEWWWVIDNVMYCRSGSGYFMWYDSVGEKWRYVQGLDKMMKYNYSRSHRLIEVVNCGEEIVFMWEMCVLSRRRPNKKIVCGMVAFERLQNEICGKIKWLHGVHTLPNSYKVLRCLAVSV